MNYLIQKKVQTWDIMKASQKKQKREIIELRELRKLKEKLKTNFS